MSSVTRGLLVAGVVLSLSGAGVWVDLAQSSQSREHEAPQYLPGIASAVSSRHALVLPPPGATFDYQLGGPYRPAPGTRIVTRDRSDPPVAGTYNICYVNAFQTQPQESSWWKTHKPDLIVRDGSGRYIQDPGWPGEYLLDTSTADKRARLATIVGGWVDGCAGSGYQAVEADNLDSWTRSKGMLGRAGNVAFVKVLTTWVHRDRLAFGQKNTPELASQSRSLGFDFAVAEECHAYTECGAYTAVYGQRVLNVEYIDNGGAAAFHRACKDDHTRMSMVLRDRNLTIPSDPNYVHQLC